MNIIITGGAGFIGSHLVRRLLEAGSNITVIDNFNDYYSPELKRNNIKDFLKNSRFTLIEKDIRDNLEDIFKNNSIDLVVHLAARAGVRASLDDPKLYNDVNVLGTVNLLEYCRKFGVNKFVFGSSSSVYGTNRKTPFSEDDNLENPITPYAVTKIAAEQLCKIYSECHSISAVCLRFFTVYGPGQRPEMAIHKFTRLINNQEPIPYFGDGKSGRDYTYVDDIVDGIISAVNKNIKFEIINLGDSRVVKLNEMVGLIESSLGKKAKLNNMPNQPGDVPVTFADISKAKRILGYEPKVNIKDGIGKFVKWYLDNLQ